ncbi:hypothetical protein FBUS_02893 [Fasciolopsis buskii]|uniref:Uncharacterized protein n=1 Tax=Fasciolopsis buskii TaxID=27845 RepID=A0A8E0S1H7_9TREM|nr:hypothetical protein FBUS_02893 [Fasciolopsis buski]
MSSQPRNHNATVPCHRRTRLHRVRPCRFGIRQPSEAAVQRLRERIMPTMLELQYYQREIRRLRDLQQDQELRNRATDLGSSWTPRHCSCRNTGSSLISTPLRTRRSPRIKCHCIGCCREPNCCSNYPRCPSIRQGRIQPDKPTILMC